MTAIHLDPASREVYVETLRMPTTEQRAAADTGPTADLTWVAFPEFGLWLTVTTWEGRVFLSGAAMLSNGSIELHEDTRFVEVNSFDVTSIEDQPGFIEAVNAQFGTHFTPASFPGR